MAKNDIEDEHQLIIDEANDSGVQGISRNDSESDIYGTSALTKRKHS